MGSRGSKPLSGKEEFKEDIDAQSTTVASEDAASPASPTPFEAEHVGKFSVGDPVCVFSRHRGDWHRDGTVVRVLEEAAALKPDLHMPAGAALVAYDDGNYAKWVPPQAFEAELRKADFEEGDVVSVFCRGWGLWVADGVVVQVLPEASSVEDGLLMPAGAVKVTYASGSSAKWVPPEEFDQELRAQRQVSVDELEHQISMTMREEHGAGNAQAVEFLAPSIVLETPIMPAADSPCSTLDSSLAKHGTSESIASKSPSQRISNRVSRGLSRILFAEVPEEEEEEDNDDDAYIVSAAADVDSRVVGRYHRVGEHKDRPKYKNGRGAIMYCDGHWKMNVKDDTLHWCFELRGAPDDTPSSGTWAAGRFYGKDTPSGPQVAKASEVELFSVAGVSGPGCAVNGRYAEAGTHNDKPKYKNSRGAIIFFDGYWKMNDRDDVLAWRFAVKGATGPQPPAGEWAAHWSVGKEQPSAHLSMHGEEGKTV